MLLAIIILLSVLLVISFIFSISMSISLRNTKIIMKDYSSMMYSLMKTNERYNENMNDIQKDVTTTQESLKSLTSSIRSLVKQQHEENDKKILPGPQLLKMLDDIITETILMQASLMQNQIVPDSAVNEIGEIVQATFPHIDQKYIGKRILYIMNEYNRSKTGQKAS